MARSVLPSAPLHIVLALLEGDKHGYALMGDVERMSDGAITMGPGTLYGTLKRLVQDGLIEETTPHADPAVSDERRRYYRLTAEGEAVAAAELARLRTLVHRVQRLRARPDVRPA
jgi:DNA-binding PadR family transcriptional regulator